MAELTLDQAIAARDAALRDGNGPAAAYFAQKATEMKNARPDTTRQTPPGFFPNPDTGQMTSREMLRNAEGMDMGRGEAAAIAAGQGGFFNFGDELAGLLSGGERRQIVTERERAKDEAAQAKYPNTYAMAQIAGAALPAAFSAPAAMGRTILGQTARGAGIGAVEGGLFGAGRGETLAERGQNAVSDGLAGMGLGGAVPWAAPIVKGLLTTPVGALRQITKAPSKSRANLLLAETIERSGKTPDQIAAEIDYARSIGQPEFRAMDAMGDAGARRASGIANSGDTAAQEIVDFLESRQAAQAERVARFVEEGFATGGDTAKQRASALTEARGAAADAAYDAARGNAAPVDVRGAVAVIDDRIGGMQGSGVSGDGIDGKLSRIRGRLINETDDGTIELSDFDRVLGVKQDVGDMIGEAVRAGRGNEARELGKVMTALDQALEAASPSYRTANDQFAQASRVIDSVDTGSQMARPGARAADSVDTFNAMTPEQQAAARVGYADRQLAALERNAAPTADKSKPFRSPKVAAESEAMTVDGLFGPRIQNEGQMYSTFNKAIGNSTTARKQVDIEEVSRGSAGATDVLQSMGNMRFGDAAAAAIRPVLDAAQGINNETRVLLARALMSDNPREAMNIALTQKMSADTRQKLIEAIVRSSAIRAREEPAR